MGCEASKSVSVIDDRQGNGYHIKDFAANTEEQTYFTDLQIDCVTSTWPLVAKNKTKNGVSLFIEIFNLEPSLKVAFNLGDIDTKSLETNPYIRKHAQGFMDVMEFVCDNLEEVDIPENEVTRKLLFLGAKHACRPNVHFHYFHIFIKCLHIVWEQVLGEEYTVDLRDSWNAVFEFIQQKLEDGYNFYLSDKENDIAQHGDQKDEIKTVIDNHKKDEKRLQDHLKET